MGRDTDAGCAGGCANGRHANFAIAAADTEIGRRTFLVQSGLMAAAAALAACGTLGDISAPTLSGSVTVNVNSNASLSTVGGVAMVTTGGAHIVIVGLPRPGKPAGSLVEQRMPLSLLFPRMRGESDLLLGRCTQGGAL